MLRNVRYAVNPKQDNGDKHLIATTKTAQEIFLNKSSLLPYSKWDTRKNISKLTLKNYDF